MPLLACVGTLGEPDAKAETDGPFLPGPLACVSARASPVLPGQTKYASVTANLTCLVLSLLGKPLQLLCTAHKLTDVCDLDAACHNTMQ